MRAPASTARSPSKRGTDPASRLRQRACRVASDIARAAASGNANIGTRTFSDVSSPGRPR